MITRDGCNLDILFSGSAGVLISRLSISSVRGLRPLEELCPKVNLAHSTLTPVLTYSTTVESHQE